MARRRFAGILSVIAAMVGGSIAFAQEPPPSKIAFVDVQKAIVSIDEGKARLQALQSWTKPHEEELKSLTEEVKALQQEIAAKQATASSDALEDLNKRLVAKQREFEDKRRVARREFEERQGAILKEVGKKLRSVISDYAKQQQYTAIFTFKPEDLVYLDGTADITDTVVKLYNEKHPTAGAAK